MNDYKPDFKIVNSIDECIWVTGSTNKETGQNQKPDYCDKNCNGYNKNCEYYFSVEDLEIIILSKRYEDKQK